MPCRFCQIELTLKNKHSTSCRLRAATSADCDLFLEWANDPQVRAMAFHSKLIPLDSHREWFASRLASPSSHLFVFESNTHNPIGQIRFDQIAKGIYEVDVSVVQSQRGCGYGLELLKLAEAEIRIAEDVVSLRALIKPQNIASLTLFKRAGYIEKGTVAGPESQQAVLLEKTP